MSFLNYLISGISLGSVYAIIALGYTMVYGIAKMLNFAHGDIIMVGAYVVFIAMSNAGIPAIPAVLISMLVSWGILVALAGLAFVMIHFLNWGLIPVFAVLAVLLAAAAIGAYKLLMKNVKKYYFAG